ncbi:MAG: hypothetical protein FIB01_09380 [Gemmatimonadetes bacterium]|nr:hypothetical protein [Gemmatimonadota bacterium]
MVAAAASEPAGCRPAGRLWARQLPSGACADTAPAPGHRRREHGIAGGSRIPRTAPDRGPAHRGGRGAGRQHGARLLPRGPGGGARRGVRRRAACHRRSAAQPRVRRARGHRR